MLGLPDGRKSFKIGLGRVSCFDTIPVVTASHVAVAITALRRR